ncbi:polysaccharide biosynthesis C-terminal domain-containing protein [Lactiplantibacillus sp. WILCCON 0030]|uniref:Polysaccharide biosynthesis C-terminal domain-containing protein n=1 Tax=Lactiplantibacillus brownii TaxID=3069269 RepID=A0ABU1A8L2_9LACO|nr:polysaccharide biosynthesis C-terminal domain-containing protein [Lactiplantibacillus brownii]MDQ7936975.1 polysaccharide biosynthesis C-terminal domain-containing protein [Lactiplantibacillus brownii]
MQLVKNYLYNAGYNILILLTPLLTVPYISRVLGPTGVGINATTNSVITYFLLAGTVGITIYGNREIAFIRDDLKERSRVFWEIEFLQITTIALAYIAFLIFLFTETQFKVAFFYQSFYIIAGAFDISWYFMGLEDFKKTVVRNTFVKIASLVAIFTLVKTSQDVGKYILILSLSQLFGNISLWPYLINSISKPKWHELSLLKHLLPSLSLFVPQVATTVYLAVNKTMLWQLDSVTASGYYDYSDKLVKIVLAVVTATGTVMLPHIANLYAKRKFKQVKKYLYASFDFVLAISTPMAFGIAGIATTFAPWFFGQKFASVNILLMIEAPVIILIGLSNVIGQQYLLPTKRTKDFTKSVVLGALVNIIVNIPLIIYWGVRGAMLATLFSEITVTAYQLFCVRKDLAFSRLFKNFWKYLLSAFIMFLVIYNLNIQMRISVVALIEQIVVGLAIYIGMILILKPTILKRLNDLKHR